jgi:TonB family protein
MYHSIGGSQALSRRAVALGSIVALHLLVISLIASGLGKQLAQLMAPPLEVSSVVKETIPREEPPPPVDPRLYVPKTDPVPEPVFRFDTDQGPTALTAVPEPPAPPPVDTRPAPPQPIRLIGRNRLPNTEDFYPPSLIRQGIEGAAIVQACVDGNGVRRGEPTIEQTSGNAQLDEAAIRVARAGQFARAVRGDTPVPVCHRFHIGFNLK